MEKYAQDRVCWRCQAIFRDSFVTKTWDEEMEEQLCFAQEVQPNLLIKIKRSRTGAHGLGRFCSSTQSTLMVVVHTKPENILTLYYLSHKIQVDLLSGYTGQFVDQAGWKELETDERLEPARTLAAVGYLQRFETLRRGWNPVFRGIHLRSNGWRQTDTFLQMVYRGRLSIVNLCTSSHTL
jgi:hypothetical protein